MYIVEVAFKSSRLNISRKSFAVSGGYKDMELFDLLYSLSSSQYVIQFTVYSGSGTVIMPSHFGFGEFEKWVRKITYFGERE